MIVWAVSVVLAIIVAWIAWPVLCGPSTYAGRVTAAEEAGWRMRVAIVVPLIVSVLAGVLAATIVGIGFLLSVGMVWAERLMR